MRHRIKTEIEEFPFFAVVELAPTSLLFFQCDELWRSQIIVDKWNNKRLVLKMIPWFASSVFSYFQNHCILLCFKCLKLYFEILYRHQYVEINCMAISKFNFLFQLICCIFLVDQNMQSRHNHAIHEGNILEERLLYCWCLI